MAFPRRHDRVRVPAALVLAGVVLASTGGVAAAVAGDPPVGRQPDGSVQVPSGQTLTPAGRQLEMGGRPNAVALSPDGRTAAVLLASTSASLRIVDLETGQVLQSYDGAGGASVDGLAYSPDGRSLVSSVGSGSLAVTTVGADGLLGSTRRIALPVGTGGNPNPTGLAISADSGTVYVALSRHNALGVVDLASGAVTEVPVGNAPHSVVLQAGTAWVSNEGGRPATATDTTNISAGTAIVSDPFTGAATTGTVSAVDLASRTEVATVATGLHPTGLTLAGTLLYVADTGSDTVTVIDTASRTVARTVSVSPYPGARYGAQPTGTAVIDGDLLTVSLAGVNALAFYDLAGSDPAAPARVEGFLPTAWKPAAVVLDAARGQLVVPNTKGVGAVADADAGRPAKGLGEVGSVSLVPVPTLAQVRAGTATVAANNHWDRVDRACGVVGAPARAIPLHVGEPSTIKHVVYLIKENRTYDQILGDLGVGNGDPTLATFGAVAAPNQQKLARTFATFDNFYDSGRRSNDGHNWAVAGQVPDYLEKGVDTQRITLETGGTPPSSGFDALLYTPGGFLWENALRHGKTFANFGEYTAEGLTPPARSDIPSLDAHVIRDYPGYNLDYPDVMRADVFARELRGWEATGAMPDLVTMTLSNDHTGGSDPRYPTPTSQVADNDLATGRIIDRLSHSAFWASTAVFVIEDDSQGGTDHVSGQRSTLFVASPYARRGIVDSTRYNQVDVLRTIEAMLGLPPMNALDAAANPLRSAFTDTADLTPFVADERNAQALSVPNPPLASLTGIQREWAAALAAQDLTHLDAADEQLLNRDIWYSVKGYDAPYPGDPRVLHPGEVPTSTRGQGAVGAVPVEPEDRLETGPSGYAGGVVPVAVPAASDALCLPSPVVPEFARPALVAGGALALLGLAMGWVRRRAEGGMALS